MSFVFSSESGVNYWHIPAWTERGIVHGWTERTVNGSIDCTAFKEHFSLNNLLKLNQVHGIDILAADEWLRTVEVAPREWLNGTDWPPGDGWIVDHRKLKESRSAFFVRTADCFPVIVVDTVRQVTLNLHCGWRGTVDGLLKSGLELLKSGGSNVTDIEVGIGPGIRSCCFEVRAETADRVRIAGLECGADAIEFGEEGVICGDLPSILRGQARSFGVSAVLIFELPICTACDHRFFSFRRNPEDPGRQVTFVVA
jgi:YfiH family protein